jgi:hypothetical protein
MWIAYRADTIPAEANTQTDQNRGQDWVVLIEFRPLGQRPTLHPKLVPLQNDRHDREADDEDEDQDFAHVLRKPMPADHESSLYVDRFVLRKDQIKDRSRG